MKKALSILATATVVSSLDRGPHLAVRTSAPLAFTRLFRSILFHCPSLLTSSPLPPCFLPPASPPSAPSPVLPVPCRPQGGGGPDPVPRSLECGGEEEEDGEARGEGKEGDEEQSAV